MSGSNTTWESKGFFYFLIQASNSYTILLLFVSAALAFGADITDQGLKYGWHDGVAILIAIFVLVVFPSVSNFYRERNMLKKLLKDKRKLEVNVLRNGNTQCLPISDVKTGDRVFLKKGDYIPADGLFVDGENFILDEILNSKIDHVRNPFLFAGSKVMDGHGSMLVISIGANTAWGDEVLKLFSTHGSNEKKLFPSLMDKSYAYMDTLSLCISVVIALVVLIRILVSRKESNRDLPELKGEVSMKFVMEVFERVLLKPQGKVSILASMLVTIVIGIQHGMPIVITFSLCCWNEKLEANQVNPQNISACVSMGQVTRIFLDASGICKEVEVKEFWAGEKDIISNELGNENDGEVLAALHRGIGLPLLPEVSVSPRNAPLISWMEGRWNLNMEILDKNFIISNERLNSSSRVDGALTWKTRDEGYIHCKGAASMVLKKSTHFYDTEGKKHAIGSQKGSFEKVIENMENHGLRPLAFACRKTEDIKEFKEDGLNLLAILGLQYRRIHGIKSVVEALTKAGVMAKLVSDDELSAVRAIAQELGFFIEGTNNVAIEGLEIREMTEPERIEKVDQTTLMGNCLPRDKLLMVEDSKKKGHVVAFYGGLTIGDALALKSSDLVITEKIRCTEKAKELSDISISNFSSLCLILKYGRCAYHNIQKFFQLQYTALISGLIISFVATVHSGDSPLAALHLIWMNWILCLLGGFMIAMDLEAQELLNAQPAKRTRSLLTKVIWRNIVIQVSYQVSIFFIFEFRGHMLLSFIGEKDVQKTMIFNTFILCQLFNLFNVMALVKKQVLDVVLRSYWFLVALGAVVVVQFLIIEFGKDVANCVRLNALQWTFCFLLAAFSWVFDWAIKQVLASFPSYRSAWDFANRGLFPYVSYLGFPIFSMCLIFSVSYYVHPNIAYSN